MRLVIEASDFRRLSMETQKELLGYFAGPGFVDAKENRRRGQYEWREPMDLNRDLTVQLMHGLAENHLRRMKLFTHRDGRVTVKQLLRATGDSDPRVLSYFQSVVTRKLRRILGDSEKKAFLIGWDYDSTKWNKQHTEIVDGTYYVTNKTAASLRSYFARASA
jgi:hypothetical protein